MKHNLRCPLLAATTAAALVGPVCAESIWQRRDPQHAYLFIDTNARCVGDLLTVLIAQDTNVNNRDNREMSKESSLSEGFNLAGASSGGLGEQAASASLDISNEADREFKGDASYRSQRAFTDRVTVTVRDVLPNGNLVISGKRRVWVGGDETVLVLTGVVRGIDIAPDNSISSRFVSELSMSYEGRGPEKAFTRQGWLGRGMNKFWPF